MTEWGRREIGDFPILSVSAGQLAESEILASANEGPRPLQGTNTVPPLATSTVRVFEFSVNESQVAGASGNVGVACAGTGAASRPRAVSVTAEPACSAFDVAAANALLRWLSSVFIAIPSSGKGPTGVRADATAGRVGRYQGFP